MNQVIGSHVQTTTHKTVWPVDKSIPDREFIQHWFNTLWIRMMIK